MTSKDLLITLPNSALREKSKKISVISDEVRQVIEEMKAATLDWESTREHEVGVALAAVQIDHSLRIVIVRNNFDNKEDQSFSVFINPEVIKLDGDLEEDFEGCLSITDVYGKVPRYTKVKIRALNEKGQEIRVKAEGFLARVFQHEIDHLNGVVFIDHIEDNPEAFFKLTKTGKLTKYPYEKLKQAHLFR